MTIFAQSYLTPNSDVLVYTATAACTVSVLAWNSNSTGSVQIKIGLVPSGGSVSTSSWVDGPFVDAYQPLTREGIPLAAGDMVYLRTSGAGVSVSVVGVSPT